MEINTICSECEMSLWAKGHYDKADFVKAALEQYRETVSPDDVRCIYWRATPDQEHRFVYSETRPGRGAFPVTVVGI